MAGKWRTAKREVIATLKQGLQEACNDTARDLLHAGAANAPRRSGALATSGYTVTPKGSGYDAAASRTRSANRRAAIAPPAELQQVQGHLRALVAFSAGYALPVHSGYHHVRTGRRVSGQPFLSVAASEQREQFATRCAAVLVSLSAIHVKTPQEARAAREARQEESYRRSQKRAANASLRASQASFYESVVEISGEKMQRLRLPSGHYETMGEMWERVRNAAEHAKGFK